MTERSQPDFDTRRALEIELETRLNVGDFDMDKMIDVVNLMWRNRDKIMGTVDNVWDNWDDIMATVDVVMRNRDAFLGVLDWARRHSARLVDLADSLPDLLHKTGDGIDAAGASARQAGRFLAGSKDDDATSASELMDMAAIALERCRVELNKAADMLALLGDEIDDVRIPRLSPRYVEVMGVRVVNGVDVGESSLIDTAAKRLKGGAARLSQVGEDLENVAGKMRNLGGQLTEAGTDLAKVGDQLSGSGDLLRSLSLLDIAPAADAPVGITVEMPSRQFTAGDGPATRTGPTVALEPAAASSSGVGTTATKPKAGASKASASKTATSQTAASKTTASKSATAKGAKPKATTAKPAKAKPTTSAPPKSPASGTSTKTTSTKKTSTKKAAPKETAPKKAGTGKSTTRKKSTK